jgi:heterodisulfide reductase subunit A-like polyferredoxin
VCRYIHPWDGILIAEPAGKPSDIAANCAVATAAAAAAARVAFVHLHRKSEYAAFDPLFWLLHSAVDRCVWLFQNNNHEGGGWVEPGKMR